MDVRTENKLHMPQKRQFLILIPFAMFYTVAAMLGQLEKTASLGIVRNLGRAALWFAGSYVVLLLMCTVISRRDVIAQVIPFCADLPARRRRKGKWYIYLLFTAICLICYLPYFLMYYPGWLNNDAVWQVEQILGWAPASNHHPYFHTLIMKVFFMIGYRLSGTYTGGAAFYTFCQVLVMAVVFGFFLYQLYRKGTRLVWLAVAVFFYAALPINGLLTICMGKDEFFTAALLFFAWMTAEYDLDMEKGGKWAAYFTAGLLLCLLRSNGIFIFLGTSVVLLIVRVRERRRMSTAGTRQDALSSQHVAASGEGIVNSNMRKFPVRTFTCVAAVLLCYLIYHGPVLHALEVEPPDTIEGLTMPTQHILCAYLKGGELTEEEIEMIDQAVPVDQVGDYYNPWLFDPVKNFIREEGNQQVIADNKREYFKLWLRVGLRNPLQYMVAQVRQTSGYWAYSGRDYEYVYGEYYMVDNPFGITTQRKLFTYDNELAMHDFLMGFQDLYNKVWSLGLNTWLMVFGMAYMAYTRRNMMVYVPFIMMLGTLLLAAPVYNEFRYAYGLFAAFPMLFHYTYTCTSISSSTQFTMKVRDFHSMDGHAACQSGRLSMMGVSSEKYGAGIRCEHAGGGQMKKWCKAALFIIPLLCLVAAVNWYVDSYAYLRVTYDQIGEQMAVYSMNVTGLEESDFNDRKLLLACLRQQEEAKELIVAGSSRVLNFEHTMFGTDSFYNTGLSESTFQDLLAVAGILEQSGRLPEKMVIGVDAFLFNTSHNNDRWMDLEEYAVYMEEQLVSEMQDDSVHGETASDGEDGRPDQSGSSDPEDEKTGSGSSVEKTRTYAGSKIITGRDHSKWLSLDYFRYNVTLLPERKRFLTGYTQEWETEQYLKHYDGSIAYQKSLREVDVQDVEELTRQAMEERVVYRMTDYKEIDERSMELFDALIGHLQARGVEVMLYLPPYSPMMYNYIESEEQYQITFQVEERIRQLAQDRHTALYGSYNPAECGLEMTDLYDIYHVKTEKMPDTFYPVLLPE